MDFETMCLFQDRMNEVGDFNYFPREWEEDYLSQLKDYEKEKFIDFVEESGIKKIPALNEIAPKNFTGFVDSGEMISDTSIHSSFFLYFKDGVFKYSQKFVCEKGKNGREYYNSVFLDSSFRIARDYILLPGQKPSLSSIFRMGTFPLDEERTIRVHQYSLNKYEIGFFLRKDFLFRINVNGNENFDEKYLAEKIRMDSFIFSSSGDVARIFKKCKVFPDKEYSNFGKMSLPLAIHEWERFKEGF